jgi:hypothetical protein
MMERIASREDMGYFVRVFCTAGEPPVLRPVLAHALNRGSAIELDPDGGGTSLDDASWSHVGLLYKSGKLPIRLEVNRTEGNGGLVREEIDEFMEFLEDAPNNANRKRVEDHLRATTFVVAAQLPTSDIDDDGYNALGNTSTYFVEHNDGMIQADGEGFYDGTNVIVKLR